MDFALSAPHVEIRRTVRDFAEREIAPVADEMERRGEFPHGDHPQGSRARPAGRAVPGGGRRHRARHARLRHHRRGAVARLGQRGDHRQRAHQPRLRARSSPAGTPEQQERYLRPLASGAKLGAYGLTEPGAGSDSRGTRTRAHRDGDELGASTAASASSPTPGVAETYIVTAVTRPQHGLRQDQRLHRRGGHARASPSAGWRRRWGSTPATPASCSSTTAASRPRTCSARRARGIGSS